MSLSTIILESGGVFAHNTNQDGSGNIGVNVENTPSVSVSNFPVPSNTTTGDAGTYTASFNGTTQTNSGYRGALVCVALGAVSGTNPELALAIQWSPDGGTTWVNYSQPFGYLTSSNQQAFISMYPDASFQNSDSTTAVLALAAPAPKTWRMKYTISGTSPSFVISNVYVSYVI